MSGHHHHHDHDHSHGHDDHHHHHGEGDDHHSHDHSNDLTPALQNNLYDQIDFDAITTLNEAVPRSGAAIVKKVWAERLNAEPELESDADEQLLMYIPFTSQTKLHSILLSLTPSESSPSTLKLFKNRNDLDFSAASDTPPTQTLSLPQPPTASVVEIPLNRAQWNTTTSITLFFEDNHGGGDEDVTRLAYLGFKGEWMKLIREPVTFLYEAAARPSDHKVIQGLGVGASQGMDGR